MLNIDIMQDGLLENWDFLKRIIAFVLWKRKCDITNYFFVDWGKLYSLAKAQTVNGLFIEAANQLLIDTTLNHPQLIIKVPTEDEVLEWSCDLQKIQRQNQLLNKALSRIHSELSKNGVRYIVMKGQVCAKRWVNPEYRVPGDIDLLIHCDDYEVAKQIFDKLGAAVLHDGFKHIEYEFGGIVWELHYMLHRFAQSQLQHLLDAKVNKDLISPYIIAIEVNGLDAICIPVFSPELELTHLLLHFVHHVIHEGCGLRQLIDFALVLHDNLPKCDLNILNDSITELQLSRSLQVVLCLCENVLGMPKCELSRSIHTLQDMALARKIEKRMLKDGNFGHGSGWEKADGLYGSICYNVRTFRRSLPFITLWPKEILLFPLEVLSRRMR